ncbi:biotin/lipoyl-containing protein [Pectinatus sottacetonis]|uniref:biotin/lipoyl-containing protein n=1 Tax=Pectinatus sottacetonis TaxID=1002795 RepID=UPI0018C4E3B7|nr:biotin/lipoyl-containing protein [Pectinatus sottacetonis]
MKKKLLLAFIIGIGIIAGIYHMATAQSMINEKSALSGTVSWTAVPGNNVTQGSELVKISTITGSTTACRASADGIVKEILVHPGEKIEAGQIVARIITK